MEGFFDFSGGGGGSQNQFFQNLPSLPQSGVQAAASQPWFPTPGTVSPGQDYFHVDYPGSPFSWKLPGGYRASSTLDPNLTGNLFDYIDSMIGKGATPFNLQSIMPSTGGVTDPGQLTAGLTPLLAALQNFYEGGGSSGIPGLDTLQQISQSGLPVLPQWKAMTDAMQRSIDEGAAGLKGQFAFSGALAGSPFGTAMTDYQTQAAKDKEALLVPLEQQSFAQQQAAASELRGGATELGKFMQGLDQASIDRLLQEYIRTRPEYSPLLNMQYGAATTFPQLYKGTSGLGGLGGLLQSLGPLLSFIPGIGPFLGIAAGVLGSKAKGPSDYPASPDMGGQGTIP